MKTALLVSTLLLATALPHVPTAEAAWDGCVNYMYVADYHWYYVCIQPKNPTCPVLWKERHGMTWSSSCIVP